MTKEKKSKVTEIVLLAVFGSLWLLGFILAVLGMVAFNAPGRLSDNALYQAQKGLAKFLGMKGLVDFRILGSVVLIVAMIFIIWTLYHYANKYDAIKAKKARREERMKALLSDDVQSVKSVPASETKTE